MTTIPAPEPGSVIWAENFYPSPGEMFSVSSDPATRVTVLAAKFNELGYPGVLAKSLELLTRANKLGMEERQHRAAAEARLQQAHHAFLNGRLEVEEYVAEVDRETGRWVTVDGEGWPWGRRR